MISTCRDAVVKATKKERGIIAKKTTLNRIFQKLDLNNSASINKANVTKKV